MRALALLVFLAGALYGLAAVLLVRLVGHAPARAVLPRPTFPGPLPPVQRAHPGPEVGRPAAPGAAPPGRPMLNHTSTVRASHPFLQR